MEEELREGRQEKEKASLKRLFSGVKQTLIKLEGEKLSVTIKPGEYVCLDLFRRHFKLPSEFSSSGIGEPVITLKKIYLPIHFEDGVQNEKPQVAWDFNLLSLDGYSPETKWIRIDTSRLASVHISSFEKEEAFRGGLPAQKKRGKN